MPIYIGGPVAQDSLFFIVQQDAPLLKEASQITGDLYLGGDFEHLNDLLTNGEVSVEQCRFFLGYSGWSDGQLESELESKSWIVSDLDSEQIFQTNPKLMWQQVLKNMGGKYKEISNYPSDPRLN